MSGLPTNWPGIYILSCFDSDLTTFVKLLFGHKKDLLKTASMQEFIVVFHFQMIVYECSAVVVWIRHKSNVNCTMSVYMQI